MHRSYETILRHSGRFAKVCWGQSDRFEYVCGWPAYPPTAADLVRQSR
jgi:hypothetical protein